MAKSLMKETSLEENKLKNENDRLKQRQMLKEDEIKDLREKKLKLELEIKETKQRELMVSFWDPIFVPNSFSILPISKKRLYSSSSFAILLWPVFLFTVNCGNYETGWFNYAYTDVTVSRGSSFNNPETSELPKVIWRLRGELISANILASAKL